MGVLVLVGRFVAVGASVGSSVRVIVGVVSTCVSTAGIVRVAARVALGNTGEGEWPGVSVWIGGTLVSVAGEA